MPKLNFGFDYRQFFSVIGPLGVTLAGQIGATADLSFGYDTKGLRQFRAGRIASLDLNADASLAL